MKQKWIKNIFKIIGVIILILFIAFAILFYRIFSPKSETVIFENIVFKVQIAASSRKLEPKSYNFKGLEDISREQESKLYKYFFGSTNNYNEAKRLEDIAKQKFKNSFIVAYKNGKKIELSEALKSSSN